MKVYTDPKYGTIRGFYSEGNVYLCAKDIEVHIPNKNTDAHRKKSVHRILRSSITQNNKVRPMTYIPEIDLPSYLGSFYTSNIEEISNWIYGSIIPFFKEQEKDTITAQPVPSSEEKLYVNPDSVIKILEQLKEENFKRKKLEEEIEKKKRIVTLLYQEFVCGGEQKNA